jgi:hypothetical protein
MLWWGAEHFDFFVVGVGVSGCGHAVLVVAYSISIVLKG